MVLVETGAKFRYTHTGYCDESSWNDNRYRSIGLITASNETAERLEHCLTNAKKGQGEVAWKSVRTGSKLSEAKEWLSIAVDWVCDKHTRIDVIVWDTKDSRHANVRKRDDTANLERMFNRLVRHAVEQWPEGIFWKIRPDERSDLDWKSQESYLPSRSRKSAAQSHQDTMWPGQPSIGPRHRVQIEQVSSGHSLIQLADLFAGLAGFSWNAVDAHRQWSGQLSMFELDAGSVISKSSGYKHEALDFFLDLCGERRFGVRMAAINRAGLHSPNPSSPMNFWHYTPQGAYDKAPTKTR